MADENNSSGQEPVVVPNGEQPTTPSPDGSSKPQISAAEQSRREQQAERDRQAVKGKDDQDERLSFLEARETERMRNETVNEFLAQNADKYPDIKPDDPMFKYAGSKEDIEEIAKNLQSRFMDMQQKALLSVQEDGLKELSDEEIAAKVTELEEETAKTGKSNFGSFLDTISRRKK